MSGLSVFVLSTPWNVPTYTCTGIGRWSPCHRPSPEPRAIPPATTSRLPCCSCSCRLSLIIATDLLAHISQVRSIGHEVPGYRGGVVQSETPSYGQVVTNLIIDRRAPRRSVVEGLVRRRHHARHAGALMSAIVPAICACSKAHDRARDDVDRVEPRAPPRTHRVGPPP